MRLEALYQTRLQERGAMLQRAQRDTVAQLRRIARQRQAVEVFSYFIELDSDTPSRLPFRSHSNAALSIVQSPRCPSVILSRTMPIHLPRSLRQLIERYGREREI